MPGNGYGLGQCHYMPTSKPDDLVDWAYDTTVPLHWRTLEPSESQYDFSRLDTLVARASKANMQLWLSIETVGFGIDGLPKAPQWLLDKGARWHYGSCSKDGLIAPWDTVYEQRLPSLLHSVAVHIAAQDVSYQATIGGIVAMSGGMYGEMQLWSCDMKHNLKVAYGMDTATLNETYIAAAQWLMDTYMDAFPGLPVIWHLGYSSYGDEMVVESQTVQYGARAYADRIRYKWNGLDPVNGRDWQLSSNRWYSDMFRSLAGQGIAVGYEAGHPSQYRIGNAWNPAAFAEVFQWALDSKASFMCFQPEMWPGVFAATGWQAFDAALEANAPAPLPTDTPTATEEPTWTSTATPSSSPTMTPMPTPTGTETPSPTATSLPCTSTDTPTAIPTPSPTQTATPIPTSSPTASSTSTLPCTVEASETPTPTRAPETVYVALVLNEWPPECTRAPVARGWLGWLCFAAATAWAVTVACLVIRKLRRR